MREEMQTHIDNCPICQEFPELIKPKQDKKYPPNGKTYVGGIWISNLAFAQTAILYKCQKRNKLERRTEGGF